MADKKTVPDGSRRQSVHDRAPAMICGAAWLIAAGYPRSVRDVHGHFYKPYADDPKLKVKVL